MVKMKLFDVFRQMGKDWVCIGISKAKCRDCGGKIYLYQVRKPISQYDASIQFAMCDSKNCDFNSVVVFPHCDDISLDERRVKYKGKWI